MKRQMEAWRRYGQLGRGERRVVRESAAALMLNWIGLRVAGFQRWNAALARFGTSRKRTSSSDRETIETAREVARLQAAAARYLFLRTSCLEQSLTLWFVLRRRGIASDLVLGGRKEGSKFEAHAWVEIEGVVLSDPGAARQDFLPFAGALPSV